MPRKKQQAHARVDAEFIGGPVDGMVKRVKLKDITTGVFFETASGSHVYTLRDGEGVRYGYDGWVESKEEAL